MNNTNNIKQNTPENTSPSNNNSLNAPSRRRFLGQVTAALAGGAILSKVSSAGAANLGGEAPSAPAASDPRVRQAYNIKVTAASKNAAVPVPPHTTNGDEQLYPDKSGTYTKGLLQDGIGLVNPAAFRSFRKAINSGKFSDWENIITGGPRTQNGPLGGRAFALEGIDDAQLGNAPAPAFRSTRLSCRRRRPWPARPTALS